MFDEMDRVARQGSNNTKTFAIEDITNKEIGSKIKSFSKIFLKIQIVLLAIAAFGIVIMFFNAIDYSGGMAFMILLIGGITLFLSFVMCYFGFLIISGFGALIEDTNSIKTFQVRSNKRAKASASADVDFDDLPNL